MKKNDPSRMLKADPAEGSYLPDFCHAENILKLVLVLELVAIVLVLAGAPNNSKLFLELALVSMYVQWIGLGSAGLLCLFRRWHWLRGVISATAVSLATVALVTLVMAVIGWRLEQMLGYGYFRHQPLPSMLAQHVAISLILYGLTLRYFFVQYESRKTLQAESRARLQALQARIRPHFLFNSLNTIASLTHEQPDLAEEAIENLSDLFRASLRADNRVTLTSEIELTRQYIELEALRLDDRLKVEWHIDADTDQLSLPGLTLQPLVENAIYHGIEPLPEGGVVRIDIDQDDALRIRISNPLSVSREKTAREGNQMALDNIRERLEIAYQGQAKIEHLQENDLYTVCIRTPLGVSA